MHCARRKHRKAGDRVLLYKIVLRTIELTAKVSRCYACGLIFFGWLFFPVRLSCISLNSLSFHCIWRVCPFDFSYTMSWFCFMVMNVLLITSSLLVSPFNLIRTRSTVYRKNFFSQFTFDRHFKSSVNSIRAFILLHSSSFVCWLPQFFFLSSIISNRKTKLLAFVWIYFIALLSILRVWLSVNTCYVTYHRRWNTVTVFHV